MGTLDNLGKDLYNAGKSVYGAKKKDDRAGIIHKDGIAKQYLFKLTGDGLEEVQFSKISGYSSEIEIDYVQEGGINDFSHPFIKGAKHSKVTLEKGMTDSEVLWKWYEDALNGKVVRKDITIEMMNNGKTPMLHWTFKRAFPVKWEGTELDALNNGLIFEKLVIEHEGMVRAIPAPPPQSDFDKLKGAFKSEKKNRVDKAAKDLKKAKQALKKKKAKKENDDKIAAIKKARDARVAALKAKKAAEDKKEDKKKDDKTEKEKKRKEKSDLRKSIEKIMDVAKI